MPEVRVDPIPAGRVGHRDVRRVLPRRSLGDHSLLLLGGVHVALTAHNQLRAAHRAVAPDLGVIAVIADDQADLESLGAFAYIRLVAGVPSLYWAPWADLAIPLHDLALGIHQDQGVVRILPGVLLVPLAGQRKNPPDAVLTASLREDVGLVARDLSRALEHLVAVVEDAVGRVLREDYEIHTGPTPLQAFDPTSDLLAILDHFPAGVQTRHPVVDDTDANMIGTGADVSVSHKPSPSIGSTTLLDVLRGGLTHARNPKPKFPRSTGLVVRAVPVGS